MKKVFCGAALALLTCVGAQAERVDVDSGGPIGPALSLGMQLRNAKKPFVIGGRCYSACTVTADVARPYSCIESGASLYFHRGMQYGPDMKVVRRYSDGQVMRIEGTVIARNTDLTGYYSADIQAWIASRGGLPLDGRVLLVMPYSEALRFFRKCTWKERWG